MKLPAEFFSGYWKEGHVQGIAVDAEKGHVYYSFTTILLKTDFAGKPLGSVRNLAGHLGCITLDSKRRRVYGSLELKHDSIGQGIIDRTGWNPSQEDNFYLVCFDIDKIDRMEMDAEADGIMRSVWLAEVCRHYKATDPCSGKSHQYGCSGIDGTGLGPVFGAEPDSPEKIMVAYGIYSDPERQDNDHQVILQYDPNIFDIYGQPLNQSQPHHCGPDSAQACYFLYTGNTRWGIQNLEYDPQSRCWLVAVYTGQKEGFTNFPLFLIDGAMAPRIQPLAGRNGELGSILTLAQLGSAGKNGIRGCWFPLGSTGIAALGNGLYCFSKPGEDQTDKAFCSTVIAHRMDTGTETLFYKA